jgi:hypothetical protein
LCGDKSFQICARRSGREVQLRLYHDAVQANYYAAVPKFSFLFALPLLLLVWASSALPADVEADSSSVIMEQTSSSTVDSSQLEQDLQHLNWKQFRLVIESVPKLKADVDAYGPLGWQYVQANYAKYGWKKNIDKLDGVQRQQLADLIQTAKSSQ